MNKDNWLAAATLAWTSNLQRPLLLMATLLLVACGTTAVARAQTGHGESPATLPADTMTQYPKALRGHWMPKDMACPSPINYDSDSLIVIEKDRLAQYEDGNKPVRVRQVSSEPQTWVIESLLNIAGDGYDIPITEIFVLGRSGLTIVSTDEVNAYRKCD